MAIVVTATNNYSIANSNRVCLRTSAGIPYVVVWNTSGNDIEIYKGDSATPTAFTEQDTADNPSTNTLGCGSAAIDSTGVIHIVYMSYISKSDDLMYVTYATATDQWGTPVAINSDLGAESTSLANLFTSIAIDSNDIPHIAYVGVEASAGTIGFVVRYENRIGGAWNGTGVEVEGQTGNKDCKQPNIAIDENNIPVISYLNDDDDDLARAVGNANDATSFTLVDLDATALSGSCTSICVDSAGVIYVAGVDSDGKIMVYNETTQKLTATVGSAPSLVADGTDIYVFYEDANNDICYDKTTDGGTTWLGSTVLETGTFNTVKAKWGFWVDNGSGGALRVDNTILDSYSETNSDNFVIKSTYQYIGQSFTGLGGQLSSVKFYLYADVDNMPSGNCYAQIYAHTGVYGDGSTGVATGDPLATSDAYDVATIPTSAALITFTFSGVNKIFLRQGTPYVAVFKNSQTDGAYVYVGRDVTSSSHSGDGCIKSEGGEWTAANRDFIFYVYAKVFISATELDYVFTDETASPDIWWNKLALSTVNNYTAAPSETLALTQALTRASTFNIAKLESLVQAESPTRQVGFTLTALATLALTEAITLVKGYVQTISETLSLTQIYSQISQFALTISKILSLTEAKTLVSNFAKSVSETIQLVEDVVAQYSQGIQQYIETLSETLSLTETISKLQGFFHSIAETLSLTETKTAIVGYIKSLSEIISLTDTLTTLRSYLAMLTETLSITETLTKIQGFVQTITSTISLTEAKTFVAGYFNSLSETLSLTEALTTLKSFFSTIAETLSLTEAKSFLSSFTNTISENLSLTEVVSKLSSFATTISETLSLTDIATAIKSGYAYFVDRTEVIWISTHQVINEYYETLTATLALTENVIKQSQFYQTLTAEISIADILTIGQGYIATILNYLYIDENVADSYTINAEGLNIAYYVGDPFFKYAQSFTGDGRIVNKVAFYGYRAGSPTGNCYAKIYAHSGTYGSGGIPTGSALAISSAKDISTISTNYGLVYFTFPQPPLLENGTKYFLSFEHDGGDASNSFTICGKDYGLGHTGNIARYSSEWYSVATGDLFFYVYTFPIQISFTQTLAQTLSLTEITTFLKSSIISIFETLSLTDTLTRISVFYQSVIETLSLAISLSFYREFIETISETLSLAEIYSSITSYFRTISETLSLTEALTSIRQLLYDTIETITLSETFTKANVFYATISEALSLTQIVSFIGRFWDYTTKNIATWSSVVKNTATWNSISKNIASWTDRSKNTTSWNESSKSSSIWTFKDKSD